MLFSGGRELLLHVRELDSASRWAVSAAAETSRPRSGHGSARHVGSDLAFVLTMSARVVSIFVMLAEAGVALGFLDEVLLDARRIGSDSSRSARGGFRVLELLLLRQERDSRCERGLVALWLATSSSYRS